MTGKTRRSRIDAEDYDDEDDIATPPWVDDDEDKPKATTRKRTAPAALVEDEDDTSVEDGGEETVVPRVMRGRKEIRSQRRSGGPGIFFRWPEDGEVAVVKFLPDDPWSYQQHWVQRTAGRRSFPCIGSKCPLCEAGEKKSERVVYSVINMSLGEPIVQSLEVGTTLDDTLATYHSDVKTGPLDRLFWALSRTKAARPSGFARFNYSFVPIKERDLDEDYGINPAEVDDVEDPQPIEPEVMFGKITRQMLQEVADEA